MLVWGRARRQRVRWFHFRAAATLRRRDQHGRGFWHLQRRQRALQEDWRGEIEGLDLTLTFLRSKREQARRFQKVGPVSLGIPMIPRQKYEVTGE